MARRTCGEKGQNSRLGNCEEKQQLTAIMSTTVLPPHQSKQSSRKTKKAWRKNIDLNEVESGVEQVREEIIKGYAFLCPGHSMANWIRNELNH